ncbi:MAG: orotidine-5'-phosphate decarboxylase [Ignavibacteria bacterium]|nr:orotidine-5'-phosphate decarboxylase [Ignavibacteria bacterium]
MTAQEKLKSKLDKNLHICVGLDSDVNKIPKKLLSEKNPILAFNKSIIETTYEYAAAYKINFAFYEKDGLKGIENLISTKELIPNNILTIADAKRGDIGNTSQMYAEAVFGNMNFDSITINPYMGFDSVEPFLKYSEKLIFILSLTSNTGSEDFEKQTLSNGVFLYKRVIQKVNEWNNLNNCGLVFGATNISDLKESIPSFNNLPILLPGIGTQGGSLTEVVNLFKNADYSNFMLNVSRSLIYCDSSLDFLTHIKSELIRLNQSIVQISSN